MGLVDKFKNFIGYPEDDYFDDDFEPDARDTRESREPRGNDDLVPAMPQESPKRSSSAEGKQGRSNKVVNIHATTQLQVVLVKPERFEDASGIADHLNGKRTIVLNLESANKDVTRRLIDFLSGVAYANNGQIKKVANSTYIITPYNVGIMGDLLDELESSGVFF